MELSFCCQTQCHWHITLNFIQSLQVIIFTKLLIRLWESANLSVKTKHGSLIANIKLYIFCCLLAFA